MDILVLCNPGSGARSERLARLKDSARSLSGAGVRMTVAETASAADAQLALNKAQLGASDLLLISGGDGTIQASLSWLLHGDQTGIDIPTDASTGTSTGTSTDTNPHTNPESASREQPVVALLPGGSTNMTALDINRTRGWQQCLDAFLGHVNESHNRPVVSRGLVSVRDGDSERAGFFVGAGAIVHGIEYCNNVLWAGGAARRERTAGLAMLRTIWGVLRKQPPFDESEELAAAATLADAGTLKHSPAAGALVFATSTLDRLLVGVRPFWGSQTNEPMPYVLVERDAKLARNLPGLLGVKGFKRPLASQGFHSHNCTRLVLRTSHAYAIDGELFTPQRGEVELTIEHSLRFLEL